MPKLDYEQRREAEAKHFSIRVSVLDAEVAKLRGTNSEGKSNAQMFPAIELWPDAVDGASLLDDVYAVVQRFIVCKTETARAVTLWIAFTWFSDHVQVAPLAVITAPEKRCGKSQLLSLIGQLARRPLVASNISPAAVYRVIDAHNPTLLIDEADTPFSSTTPQQNDEKPYLPSIPVVAMCPQHFDIDSQSATHNALANIDCFVVADKDADK